MKIARVLITTECNLKCGYCCNKLPEIQKSVKITTFDEFIEMDYDVVNITGGEPMLAQKKLDKLLEKILPKHPKIYLYTNGLIIPDNIEDYVGSFDGVNIGCHNNFDDSFYGACQWVEIGTSVRFHAQKNKLRICEKELLKMNYIDLKEWVMDECDNTKEDRWII